MKKIILSLSIIAAVAAIAIGATTALFSDEEKSVGTFSAGTIDIAIDNENPWVKKPYSIGDLKPGETGYINFDIKNVGENPVNVSKNLGNFTPGNGIEEFECDGVREGYKASSEPECVREKQIGIKNDIQTQLKYDLSVEVYDSKEARIWWQEIYNADEHKSLADIYGENGTEYVDLGMIPVDGHMKVTQSYHFDAAAGNEYQGDTLSFDINIKGEQLTGENGMASVNLENKRIGEPEWDIIQGDGISGTLSYKTQGSEFVYAFEGKAPLVNHSYVLAVGYDANTDVNKEIGIGTTDGEGNIDISGSINTGDLVNAKVWLVPSEYWVSNAMAWTNWPAMVSEFLWETGLINYNQN